MENRVAPADAIFLYTGDKYCSVPKHISSVRFIEGLQKIREGAFKNCKLLESITLPSSITEIDDGAFNSCKNLRDVTLNNGLQKIGGWAFYKCDSLESIELPTNVTEIGNNAFNNCCKLKEVILNEGLQTIGNYSFFNCDSLESIKFPSTLVVIGNYACKSCSNLREVELNGVPPYFKGAAFHNCNVLERILFPTISYHLRNLIQTNHWEELEDKLNQVRGVVQWESNKLFVSVSTHNNRNDVRRDIVRINRLVSYYELKEATSTFELALWKFNRDQVGTIDNTNRATYRIDVPGPVKDTILQYLGHTC